MNRLIVLVCCILSHALMAQALPIKNVVVFGDSLSDNGNLYEFLDHKIPVSPPYFKGRFSNGPVWIEDLVTRVYHHDPLSHLLDYAYGGAAVSQGNEEEDALFTLDHEVDEYLLEHNNQAAEDSLFIIWIGANNYLVLPPDAEAASTTINQKIKKDIVRLHQQGAKHIVLVNLPDLGKTPAALELGAKQTLTDLTVIHNNKLALLVDTLKAQYPSLDVSYLNVYERFDDIMERPDFYGFTDINGTCSASVFKRESQPILHMAQSLQPYYKTAGCDGVVFFDSVHPTAAVHQVLADLTYDMLTGIGIVFDDVF